MANKSKNTKRKSTNAAETPPIESHCEEKSNEKKRSHSNGKLLVKLTIPILLSLMVCCSLLYRNYDLWQTQRAALARPEVLLNYSQFRALYPRLREPGPVEHSRRHLLFINDLIWVASQNIGHLLGANPRPLSHLARQAPLKSDRTPVEQHDILGQLQEFNMTQITLNLKMADGQQREGGSGGPSPLDRPVSLANGGVYDEPATLRTGGRVKKWFKRKVQGDSYYEIPNFPLDEQPDPDRITHIDADLRHCSGAIHNQGHCGACYAFSWNSLAEWHHCKQSGNKQVDFSEQHLLDCGHLVGLTGCREGYLKDAMRFSDKFGFHLEADYPYKGKQASVCKQKEGPLRVKVVDFKRIQVNREEWEQTLREQPILLQVHLPSDIMSYHKGVHHGLNCDESMAHGMLLVGHGREAGIPYWILKNSMGSQWGENGYLRLSRQAPMSKCFRTGFVAKFKFESLDEEAYYDLYDSMKFEPSVHVVDDRKPAAISKAARNWLNGNNNNSQ